jgi:hypothetical protein
MHKKFVFQDALAQNLLYNVKANGPGRSTEQTRFFQEYFWGMRPLPSVPGRILDMVVTKMFVFAFFATILGLVINPYMFYMNNFDLDF